MTEPGCLVAVASAEILDGGGRLVATATSSGLVMDMRPDVTGSGGPSPPTRGVPAD